MVAKLFNLTIAIGGTFSSFYGGYLLSKKAWQSFLTGTLQTPVGLIERANMPKNVSLEIDLALDVGGNVFFVSHSFLDKDNFKLRHQPIPNGWELDNLSFAAAR